ncbi:hypothetical protein [Xanthomonas sacchari]|nr:hypothetical protein [Xanthomonas sacchari]
MNETKHEAQESLRAMKAFAAAHLPELCAEICEWHATSVLGDGVLRELAQLCAFDPSNRLQHAERLVERMSLERLASKLPAGNVEHQREAVARAVCLACEEAPDNTGDARGNAHRWQDYLPCADAAIAAFASDGAGQHPLQDAPPARRVELAAEHKGMRVDYNGMLRQVRAALGEPALSEMVHQLQGHLTALGKRWYAGDRLVVDEFLQLYCIGVEARRELTTGQVEAHG